MISARGWGGGFHGPAGDEIVQRVGDAAPAGSRCLLQFFTAGGISFAKCLENAFWQKIGGPEYHDVSSR